MPLRPLTSALSALLFACAAVAGCAAPGGPATGVIAIGQVQGRGERSLLEGRPAVVEGVVSADLREGLGGYFVQDAGDGDPATSDALFVVSAPGQGDGLRMGDRLRIEGTVVELGAASGRATLTAIEPVRVTAIGRGAVQATALQAPPLDWEALEAMQVRVEAPLTVSGSGNLDRFGELVASFAGRLWQPSEIARPGSPEFKQVLASNAVRRLVLDDASSRRDPGSVGYLAGRAAPRAGSVIDRVEGIVDQRHGSYRLQLTAPLLWQPAPRPVAPLVAGRLRVAVFNLENLFNGDGRGGGFPTGRGATTAQEFADQTARLVATLKALDPDIAALMELENDGYGADSSVAQFVATLNADGSDWRFVDAGRGPGNDQIRVGLIYRASRAQPVGAPAVLKGGPFDRRSRVPLAQAFDVGTGAPLVVVANHFKSKGCGDAAGADADQGDGQACWNAARLDSARRLDAWLKTDPTGTGSPLQLVVGDLNAYAQEDPVRALVAAGWIDAFAAASADRNTPRYSFVYDGLTGRLDHALLSPALASRLRGAAEWHSNADEPDRAGYAKAGGEGPWRSSDHDPMLLGFDL